ncbi:MAG TPA: tetratricopeptide repeat protein [Comamonas sp.]|uniref:YfgM family protein n=1 Tax=Comamonas halotolerans TaxID=3041496 RepID=UPI0024E09AAB|nr:tetratricopeptide repeat protein [Comamonas sp. NoAH]
MATHLDLEEQEQLDQIKHFWNKWGTPITGLAVVVMAGFAAWNGYQYWQQRQAIQASALADVVAVAVESGDQARVAQAFETVKADYKGTLQAGHAALLVAQSAVNAGKLPEAKAALQWAVDNTKDEGYQATAKLRLAAVLMEDKDLDGAASLLRSSFPNEFKGLAADRLGDVLQQQGKTAEAVAAYQEAWKLMDPQVDYRALVGFKLNALGVTTTQSGTTNSTETNQ